jgi:hypothetical protein
MHHMVNTTLIPLVIPWSKEAKPKLPYVCPGSYITHTMTHHGKTDAEKPSSQYLGLFMMSNWLTSVWIWIQEFSVVLPHYPVTCVENRICLSRDMQVTSLIWQAVMRIMTIVGEGAVKANRGGWMWANQNFSTELGLYPKINPAPLSSNLVKTAQL